MKKGKIGFGTSPLFELSQNIIERLLEGTELGLVMDEITGDHNTKQKGGAVGFFTKGIINRKDFLCSGINSSFNSFHKQSTF